MNIEFFQDLKSGDDNSLFECSNELTKVLTSNNLLFAISQKKMNLEDIERLTYRVMHIVASLGLDKLVLEENALIYNYQYGTSDNHFFRNHPKTLNHIEDSIMHLQRLLLLMSPKLTIHMKNYLRNSGQKLNVLHYSLLTVPEQQTFMFSETIHEKVLQLDSLFADLCHLLDDCFQICKKEIEEENIIRNNPEESLKRFHLHLDNVEDKYRFNLPPVNVDNNPAYDAFVKCKYDEAYFGQHHFHLYKLQDIVNLFIYILNYRRQKNDYTELETKVFRNDVAALKKCRYLIDHIDEMIPQRNRENKKIKGVYIYEFIEKYMMHNGQVSLTEAYNCFRERYERISGKYQLVRYSQIDGCKNAKTKNDGQSDAQAEKVKRKVDDLPCFMQNLEEWERSYLAGHGHDMGTAESLQSHDGFHATNEQVLHYSPLQTIALRTAE